MEGKIDDIFAENGFIAVKDEEFPKLENPKLGTEFELNDHRGVIVGIAKVPTGALFGTPTLYTTYNRAIHYIPSMRLPPHTSWCSRKLTPTYHTSNNRLRGSATWR